MHCIVFLCNSCDFQYLTFTLPLSPSILMLLSMNEFYIYPLFMVTLLIYLANLHCITCTSFHSTALRPVQW